MSSLQTPIIEPSDLITILGNENLILVNAGSGPVARERYLKEHIKGALYLDLDTQLSDVKDNPANGGRHPLPQVDQFGETLMQAGISNSSHVVIYDDKGGANAAARFWWMLIAAGHEKVQVLNGGIQAAEKAGIPMKSGEEKSGQRSTYKISGWELPLANMDEVEIAARSEDHMVIDVRDADRFQGLTEPIDLVAGHIPGAVNIPLSRSLDEKTLFKSPETLKILFDNELGQTPPENVIVHCGSGVTACHTILAMAYAGIGIPTLYVGSWSEWSRNNKAIATSEIDK